MPRRHDIERILIIGAGPIVIGQACEFDYSGSQGIKALKEEGYKVILINSNPATIMTDPEFADATYIEPITAEVIEQIIIKERIDAILPTLGGQTALNTVSTLHENNILVKHRVKLLGASYDAIKMAEDRDAFRSAMQRINLDIPKSAIVNSIEDAENVANELGFPLIIRPSYTLGGSGGSIVHNPEKYKSLVADGLQQSRINQVLVEESLLGWKEFELEIVRDRNDNVVIICSIENLDPMGIHTGDSITVAPAQTLTDVEYQQMRNMAKAIIREIGVDTGGANVQFAVHPKTGRIVVIEINPRVSRSSALASKATGYPIAKIAAKLAVGYTLDELPNDITKKTLASFEPTIDYCVVKIPRFTFEKFPGSTATLGVSMQSIGEAMAIGRTFKEALQKGIQSLEQDVEFGELLEKKIDKETLVSHLTLPTVDRLYYIYYAFQLGYSIDEVHKLTDIDPWFLDNILQIVEHSQYLESKNLHELTEEELRRSKEIGFSDKQLGRIYDTDEISIRKLRQTNNIIPVYKSVDTCAGEFEAYTPYYYSTYEQVDEVEVKDRKKIIILGSGPNRIGQGIEFDYCCCQASFALKELGIESIMVNCNPETVSTDYDTSDRLYFEPLTYEHVMDIIEKEKPLGVILQFGGQTPLKIAKQLNDAKISILGTSYESIDIAEDRDKFTKFITKLNLQQPKSSACWSLKNAKEIANNLGYPLLMRPSYVLGGRAMKIVHNDHDLSEFINTITNEGLQYPILIDKFLDDAIEVDVDAVCDGESCLIAGIMEHIEKAGVHSGDSACSLPPFSLNDDIINTISNITKKTALSLSIKGLINLQFAVKGDNIYILEVNPRSSRTVPFVSKATGIPWVRIATKICCHLKLKDMNITENYKTPHFSVKEVVFPFSKLSGSFIDIGVEMHSTGETMGIGKTFLEAYAKSQIAAGQIFNTGKSIYIEVNENDKRSSLFIVKQFQQLGYKIFTDYETHQVLSNMNITSHCLGGNCQDKYEKLIELIENKSLGLIVTTIKNGYAIDNKFRRKAIKSGIPLITTIEEFQLFASTNEYINNNATDYYALQDISSIKKQN